jgi:CRP-like cAMP-binding protein
MPSQVLDLLRSMALFTDLTDDELAKIARLLRENKVAENGQIFSQGDTGDGLYVVLHGRVKIASLDHAGGERVLAFYGPGEFFGDMAVVTGEPRSANAIAATDVRLLQLRKDDFDVLVATNVGVMRGMMRVMVERQTAMNVRLGQETGVGQADVRGQVTVVFSARGGAGQTVVATNLAVALAQLTPDRAAIIDMDLLFGHVAMLLDLVPRTALAAMTPNAIRSLDRENLAHYLTKHPESSLRVMAGTVRPEESEMVTAEHVHAVVELLRHQYVHVVVDAGSRFSDPCLAALELADQVIVVTTPEPAAIDATLECQRVMRDLLAIPGKRIRFVQNQPTPYGKLSRTDLAATLGTEQVTEIPYGGEEVSSAGLNGFPLVLSYAANRASRAIVDLAHELAQSGRELVALSAR